ncbi:MAG: hypothetical protein HY261_04275 [Chloroflexi bacterium]|nr:hypothetical protein [Chloroflexota bacterium]
MAMVLSVALFSFAGLPVFVGFASKFYLFASAANADLLWLVVIASVGSLISLYYYLMVVKEIYLGESREDIGALRLTIPTTSVLTAAFLTTIFFGIYPTPLIDLIEKATGVLPFGS